VSQSLFLTSRLRLLLTDEKKKNVCRSEQEFFRRSLWTVRATSMLQVDHLCVDIIPTIFESTNYV
jgi:hypothetical protein